MKQHPFVSVILPIRNEQAYIERALNAVLTQTYPSEFMEILIVDGMSNDGTRQYIKQLQQSHSHIQLLDNQKQIVPFALNQALRVAHGEIIVRVDGHCEIAADYVEQCVKQLQDHHVNCVGGPIDTIGETPQAEAIALAMGSWFGMGGSAFRTLKDQAKSVETVAFPAYTKETIDKIGLFDEELVRNQDDEYNYRLRKAGGKILLTPAIHSRYYSRGSLDKLWKQFYQYGFWKVRVLQKHPYQMRWPQFVPFMMVLSLLSTIIIPPLFIAIIVLYLAVALYAATTTAKSNKQHIKTILCAYPTMHIAYGLGFGVGLIWFIRRWGDQTGRVPIN